MQVSSHPPPKCGRPAPPANAGPGAPRLKGGAHGTNSAVAVARRRPQPPSTSGRSPPRRSARVAPRRVPSRQPPSTSVHRGPRTVSRQSLTWHHGTNRAARVPDAPNDRAQRVRRARAHLVSAVRRRALRSTRTGGHACMRSTRRPAATAARAGARGRRPGATRARVRRCPSALSATPAARRIALLRERVQPSWARGGAIMTGCGGAGLSPRRGASPGVPVRMAASSVPHRPARKRVPHGSCTRSTDRTHPTTGTGRALRMGRAVSVGFLGFLERDVIVVATSSLGGAPSRQTSTGDSEPCGAVGASTCMHAGPRGSR